MTREVCKNNENHKCNKINDFKICAKTTNEFQMCVKNKSVHRCFVGQWLRGGSGGGGRVARKSTLEGGKYSILEGRVAKKSLLEGGKYATVNMVTNLVNNVTIFDNQYQKAANIK